MGCRRALQRGAPLQRNGEWGVGFVWLCGVWQVVCRSCVSTRLPWIPPPPTYFADDRSRVKFSLLEQGPFSGLLQVWRVPVSHNPSSNAHPCARVPQAAGDAPPSSLFPCSLLPGSCTAPLVTAAVILCGQEGTVKTEDVSSLTCSVWAVLTSLLQCFLFSHCLLTC